jgi:hypothetical protein
MAQVFRSKSKMMKEMLTKKYILDVFVYVVEFQKRDLLDAHLSSFLDMYSLCFKI